jgi:CPA1 family monovalent cation:H+ antiporter
MAASPAHQPIGSGRRLGIAFFLVAALSALMACAAAAVALARRLGLPVPVVIAACGVLYGAAAEIAGSPISGVALDTYDQWFIGSLALDGDALLLLFLPPLLFEMALAVDLRRLMDEWAAVALMAVVAVAAATAFVGVAAFQATSLSLVTCLLIGAAVSTTDPAAVITTFRELGAPRRLTTLLEGESLLNDAAAIALYALLLGVAATGAASFGALASGFAASFLIGTLAGVAAALLAGQIYRLLDRSPTAEMSATVALAYGAYIAAEALGGSGVVAVVAAGVVTGTVGFVRMGPRSWSVVTAVWRQIGFWANVAILFLVASATPALLADWGLDDAALLAAVYFGALAARGLVLFGLLPATDRLGLSTPIEARQKALVLWGGVRGGVTLVLALSLAEMSALGEEARRAGAAAAGYTLLTLGLNAATLGWVTRRLGLDRLAPSDLALRERIAAGAVERVERVVRDLATARALEPEAISAAALALTQRRAAIEAEAEAAEAEDRIDFGERLRLGLAILSGQETRLVRRGFEGGAIGPRAMLALSTAAARLADGAKAGGRDGYRDAFEKGLRPGRRERLAFFLHRRLRLDGPLRAQIELRQTALLETDRVLNDLLAFAASRLPAMIGADAAANLAELLTARRARVGVEIDSVALQYPDYAMALEKTLILRAAVRRERQEYERLMRDGVIGQELHDDLAREIDRRERALARPPRLDLALRPLELLARAPLFQGLDEAQRKRLAARLKPLLVAPGEVVLDVGERGSAMYFIASGALEVRGGATPIRLATGAFFGEVALLAPTRRRGTRIVSLGYSRLLTLSRPDFRRLAERDPEIEARIRIAAANQLRRGFESAVSEAP